jgi:hypothetical protein
MNDAKECMCQGLGPQASRLMSEMLPRGEAWDHFRQARVEFLKGVRSVLDARIEELSKPPGGSQGTKIPVDG